jgi:hypothetical protein
MTDRATILVRLASLAAKNAHHDHLAARLCSAAQAILGADGAAITVENNTSSRITLATTDDIATRLEDLQDVLGEGPCRDAYRLATPVQAVLTTERERWPEFTRAALQAVGSVSMYSFPLRPGGIVFGAMTVYRTDDRELRESIATGQFVADTIGAALLRDPPSPDGLDTDGVWSSRAEVHQATGMVIAQLQISADDALALLRAHAYASNRSLAEVARQVVNREIDFQGGT